MSTTHPGAGAPAAGPPSPAGLPHRDAAASGQRPPAAEPQLRGRPDPHGDARSQRRTAARSGSWLVTVSLALVLATGSLLLRPAFTSADWFASAVVLIVVVLSSSALVRSVVGGVLRPALAGILAALVVLLLHLRPGSPGEALSGWSQQAELLLAQLASDAPPLRDTPATTLAVLVIVALVTCACDFFVFGLLGTTTAVLPVLVFLVVPAVLGIASVPLWPVALLAAAFVLFVFANRWWQQRLADDRLADAGYLVDERGLRGWPGVAAVAAGSGVIALLAASLLPVPVGVPWLLPHPAAGLPTNRANPIIDLGDTLRREEAVPVLQYATSIDEGPLPYFSLVTLTELDGGSEWAPGTFQADTRIEDGATLALPAGLEDDAEYLSFTTDIIVQPSVSAYLPQPGRAQRVSGLNGDYAQSDATGDIRQVAGEAPSQHYEIASVMPSASTAAIEALPADALDEIPAQLLDLTEVPDGAAAEEIRAELDRIADPTLPPYQRALLLQQHFTGGAFEYSETAPVPAGYDGSNMAVVASFLQLRSGYCVHFSSAMSVMARMLGIPARIQVGFTPGEQIDVNEQGQSIIQVTSHQLHAWAELWVPGYGWLPFETTPAAGLGNLVAPDPDAVPGETTPAEATTEPQAAEPDEALGAEESAPADAATPTTEPAAAQDEDGSSATGTAGLRLTLPGLLGAAAVLVLLLLLAGPALWRIARRRSRRRLVERAAPEQWRAAAAAAWQEVQDEAADHGGGLPAGALPSRQRELLLQLSASGRNASATAADPEGRTVPVAQEATRRPDGSEGPGAVDAATDAGLAAALGRIQQAQQRAVFDRGAENAPADAAEAGASPLPPHQPHPAPRALPPADWQDVRTVSRAIRRAAGPGRRLRALLAPASLRRGGPGLLTRALARMRGADVRGQARTAGLGPDPGRGGGGTGSRSGPVP